MFSSIYSIKSKFQAHEIRSKHNEHGDFKVKEIDDEQRKVRNGHLFCFIGFVEIENSMPLTKCVRRTRLNVVYFSLFVKEDGKLSMSIWTEDMWCGVCNHSWNLVAYQRESISMLSSWLHLKRTLSMSIFLTRFYLLWFCTQLATSHFNHKKLYGRPTYSKFFMRTHHKLQNEHYLIASTTTKIRANCSTRSEF